MPGLLNAISGAVMLSYIILDFCGNGFVLFATMAHNAIKLDKMCIWIIQNLAVVDFTFAIVILTPITVTMFTDATWRLGTTICQINYIFKFLFVQGNIFLINFLSINKLIRCLFPLRNMICTSRQKMAVTIVTAAVLILPVLRKFVGVHVTKRCKVIYSETHMSCFGYELDEHGNLTGEQFEWRIERISGFFYIHIPCLCLFLTNTALVFYVIRMTTRTVNRKNILIVFLVTSAFFVTFVPFVVFFQLSKNEYNVVPILRHRIVSLISMIPSFINPFIYYATNDSFRAFTKALKTRVLQSIWRNVSGSFRGMVRITSTFTRSIRLGSRGSGNTKCNHEKKNEVLDQEPEIRQGMHKSIGADAKSDMIFSVEEHIDFTKNRLSNADYETECPNFPDILGSEMIKTEDPVNCDSDEKIIE